MLLHDSFLSFFLSFFFFFGGIFPCGMQDLSSLTRDQNRAPCIGGAESYPLDHQGSPLGDSYTHWSFRISGCTSGSDSAWEKWGEDGWSSECFLFLVGPMPGFSQTPRELDPFIFFPKSWFQNAYFQYTNFLFLPSVFLKLILKIADSQEMHKTSTTMQEDNVRTSNCV